MTLAFAVIRALHFASLMTVFGACALLFQARDIGLDAAPWRRPLLFASLTALPTAVLWLIFVALEMSGDSLPSVGLIAAVAAKTYFGKTAILRILLLAALCTPRIPPGALKAAVAGAALALLGLTSHAAAAGGTGFFPARAAVDAAHLVAAGFWAGGLVVLVPQVLAKPRDVPRLIALLRLFSRWGVISVAILIVAGAINGIEILNVPGMRWSGTYVTLLAVKIVLAAMMVALALTNRFGVLPGLARGDAESEQTIPLTVVAELSCAVLIVLIVGFLGVTPPMDM